MKAQCSEGATSGPLGRSLDTYVRGLVERNVPMRREVGNLGLEASRRGGVHPIHASFSGEETNPFYWNRGDGRFVDLGTVSGLGRREDGRAVVAADLDQDGRMDLVLRNVFANPLLVFRNEVAGGRGLTVRLRGADCNRDGIGARVECDGRVREIVCGGSYLADAPHEAHFGLGAARRAGRVAVRWPCGRRQEWADVPAGGVVTLAEGQAEYARTEYRAPAAGPRARGVRTVRVGDPVELGLWSLDGREMSTRELVGREYVIHLWSTQTVSCGSDLDVYDAILAGLRERWPELELVSVNVDEEVELVRRVAGEKVSVRVWAGRGVADRFLHPERPAVPVWVLVGQDGRVRAKHVGALGVEGIVRWAQRAR